MESIARKQNLIARLGLQRVLMYPQFGADPNGHRKDVAHRMRLERFFIEPQTAADFVHPGLILGYRKERSIFVRVNAAVADAGDE